MRLVLTTGAGTSRMQQELFVTSRELDVSARVDHSQLDVSSELVSYKTRTKEFAGIGTRFKFQRKTSTKPDNSATVFVCPSVR